MRIEEFQFSHLIAVVHVIPVKDSDVLKMDLVPFKPCHYHIMELVCFLYMRNV